MRFILLLMVSLMLAFGGARAEVVEVRLEPFPPLVREDGTGLMIDQLRVLEHQTGFRFNFEIVSYSRAKYQLRNGQADLIGLVPVGRETERFYGYARELDWKIQTKADLFTTSDSVLDNGVWREGPVGTPWGNADFFAELTGLPRTRFLESSLENLVEMLSRERVPVVLFERASTLTAMQDLAARRLYYRNLYSIPAGLAVARTPAGDRLAELLNRHLPAPLKAPRFQDYLQYLTLPDRGLIDTRGSSPEAACGKAAPMLCRVE